MATTAQWGREGIVMEATVTAGMAAVGCKGAERVQGQAVCARARQGQGCGASGVKSAGAVRAQPG